jgi:hypothetical protein
MAVGLEVRKRENEGGVAAASGIRGVARLGEACDFTSVVCRVARLSEACVPRRKAPHRLTATAERGAEQPGRM